MGAAQSPVSRANSAAKSRLGLLDLAAQFRRIESLRGLGMQFRKQRVRLGEAVERGVRLALSVEQLAQRESGQYPLHPRQLAVADHT